MPILFCFVFIHTGVVQNKPSLEQGFVCETGVYLTLDHRDVLVSEDGHIYYVNSSDAYVGHFDPSGERLPNIGRNGAGPGEYQSPFRIFLDKKRLYVFDLFGSRMNVYHHDGMFLDVLKKPSGYVFEMVRDGWLAISFPKAGGDIPGSLVLLDRYMENPRPVYQWYGAVPGILDFNPMRDVCRFAVNPSRTKVFFYIPGRYRIRVLDVITGEVETLIEKAFEGYSFDREWAREEFVKSAPRRSGEPGSRMYFPETFPAIREMRFSPAGDLLVARGNRPDLMRLMRVGTDGFDDREVPVPDADIHIIAERSGLSYELDRDSDDQVLIRVSASLGSERVHEDE